MKAGCIVLILCWLNIGIGLPESAADKLFDKYANEDEITSVYISRSMMQLLPVSQLSFGWNFSNLEGKIDAIYVLSTENEEVGTMLRKEFDKLIEKESAYEQLMRVKEDDSLVKVYACKSKKGIKIRELLLVADSDDEFCAVRLSGDFTLEDLQDITKQGDKKKKSIEKK